jgi:hypothetical protein
LRRKPEITQLYNHLNGQWAFLLTDQQVYELKKQSGCWKIMLEPITGSVVISAVDAVTHVLSKAEKRVSYGKSIGITQYFGAIDEVSHKQMSF